MFATAANKSLTTGAEQIVFSERNMLKGQILSWRLPLKGSRQPGLGLTNVSICCGDLSEWRKGTAGRAESQGSSAASSRVKSHITHGEHLSCLLEIVFKHLLQCKLFSLFSKSWCFPHPLQPRCCVEIRSSLQIHGAELANLSDA